MVKSTQARAWVYVLLAFGLFTLWPIAAFGSEGNPMWRMYNSYTGEHFYTSSTDERDSLRMAGWNCEGVGWVAPTSGKDVYRLYNSYVPGGDHHYTTNQDERDSLISAGWSYEGIGWYSSGDVKLLRQYNPYAITGTHNYTADPSEDSMLVSVGWRSEGYAWSGIGGGYSVPGLGPIEQPKPSTPDNGNHGGGNNPGTANPDANVAYLVNGSNVYHTHWCRSMEKAKSYRTVSLSEAQASGRRLCKNCAQIG